MMEPDGYPSELKSHVTLENHRRLRIRPLRPCEDAPIRELYARLSPQTRYQRFFSPMPALPDSVLRLLSCIDYRTGVALIASAAALAPALVLYRRSLVRGGPLSPPREAPFQVPKGQPER